MITEKFWRALQSDMTLMLGLADAEDGHFQPMTAQLDGDAGGPLWFFTARDTDLAEGARISTASSRGAFRRERS